jgi:hypothetical protein
MWASMTKPILSQWMFCSPTHFSMISINDTHFYIKAQNQDWIGFLQ